MIEKPPTAEESPISKSSVEKPAPKKTHNLIFIFILIGIFVATAFLIPRIPGLFTKWEKLLPAPAKPIDLIGTSSFWLGPGNIFVHAEDGQV